MTIILLMIESSLPTQVCNFIIPVTLKIKDFKGHCLKVVVLQGYTQFILMNIVYLSKKYIIEVREHNTN